MAYLIPAGAIVTMIGLGLLMVCILRVAKARKAGLPEDELRAVMEATVPMNLGALCMSAIGLMMVVVGILLS
ncbi:MAG: hypothetical protein AAGA08_11305 [Pseudomonadota bacterium]